MLRPPRSVVAPVASVFVLALAAQSRGTQSAAVSIDHSAVGCAVVDRFVEIEARLAPPSSVARARVMFRAENTEHWYWTPLTVQKDRAGRFVGYVPKPLPSLKSFEYYVVATDAAFGETRTRDQRVQVLPRSGACANGSLAKSAGSLAARLVVSALTGGAPLPAGFASSGLIAGAAAGATTAAGAGGGGGAAGAGAAGAAGGISGTTIAIAGGAIAAAAGVAVATGAVGGGDGDQGSCCHGGTFNVAFTPFIDMAPCGGATMGLTGGNFSIPSGVRQPQGNFDFQMGSGPGAGTGLRLVGFISPTSFTTTLSCASGPPNTISLSATGSDYNFTGSFTFGSRTTTWTVRTWTP
jgi:hypothetical protein